jgi:ribosome biogenesis protein UTP30
MTTGNSVSEGQPQHLAKNLEKALVALAELEKKEAEKRGSQKKAKSQLLEEGSNSATGSAFYLTFGLRKIPESPSVKPVKLTVPNPWKSAADATTTLRVCLITKDPHDEYKSKVRAMDVPAITKVMGLSKLRKNFKPFEAKRQLCASYDVFLADERVLPLLPKLLGKTFFEKKKIPVPVDLTRDDLKGTLIKAIDSTYLHMASGPCFSVKFGLSSQTRDELRANATEIARQVAARIPQGWQNIKSLHMKTPLSLSLPVFLADPASVPVKASSPAPVEGVEAQQ